MAADGPGSGTQVDDADRGFAERARDAAHRPALAASGPYGHPFHPLLVTVPIGAFVCTVAFDIASKAVEGQAYGRPAQWLCAIGVVSGLVAAVFGLLDYRRLAKGTRAHKVATTHLLLMDLTLVCFIISFFLRRPAADDAFVDGTPVGAMVLAIVGLVVMLAGGWLGGRLVYTYGVRVRDDEDQLEGYVLESSRTAPSPAVTAGESSEAADELVEHDGGASESTT